jgi:mannose-6-phosphate isomerase
MAQLYPLLTQRKLVEPIWGGSTLAAWLDLPEPRPSRLGETWQVYDTNLVSNGPLAGRSLAELAREHGAAMVGTRTLARYGADVPLLAKFIDAADRLSIQVHPDDAYAHTVEAATGFHGKTEAWLIVAAAAGASVTYGMAQPSDRAAFAAAVAEGRVEELVGRIPVQAGDVVFVPAGTVHAINAGIVLFEIQQKSDLTYRVYDYDRRDATTGQPRELHLAKSLDVIDYQPPRQGLVAPLSLGSPDTALLVACPYFALERQRLEKRRATTVDPGTFEIVTLLAGALELGWAGGALGLRRGESVLIPASQGGYELSAAEPCELLRAYVPDLAALRAELRAAGHSDERIAQTVFP